MAGASMTSVNGSRCCTISATTRGRIFSTPTRCAFNAVARSSARSGEQASGLAAGQLDPHRVHRRRMRPHPEHLREVVHTGLAVRGEQLAVLHHPPPPTVDMGEPAPPPRPRPRSDPPVERVRMRPIPRRQHRRRCPAPTPIVEAPSSTAPGGVFLRAKSCNLTRNRLGLALWGPTWYPAADRDLAGQ